MPGARGLADHHLEQRGHQVRRVGKRARHRAHGGDVGEQRQGQGMAVPERSQVGTLRGGNAGPGEQLDALRP